MVAPPDPRGFIEDPQKFVATYKSLKDATVKLWTRFESELTIGLRNLDTAPYGATQFNKIKEYNTYKPLFEKLYNDLEKKVGSKRVAVLSMEIENWLNVEAVPDNDYSWLVRKYFSYIQEMNALTNSRSSDEFLMSLHCHTYAATYELGAKRLVNAAELLEGREIADVGSAISTLKDKGHTALVRSFDNLLRNGIAHNNYIVSAGPPAKVDYANIWWDRKTKTKKIQAFAKTIAEVRELTIDIVWCIMAGMYVHGSRYVDAVRSALSAVP